VEDRSEQIKRRVRVVMRNAMTESEVTQAELGKRLGIPQPRVSSMLTSRSYEPTPSEIDAFERALGLARGWVYRFAGLASWQTAEEAIFNEHELHPAAQEAVVGALTAARTWSKRSSWWPSPEQVLLYEGESEAEAEQ
jgi:hypothetical protein